MPVQLAVVGGAAPGGGAVESRTTSSVASSTWWESSFSPAASRSAVRSATPPISRSGWRTVVSGGEREPGDLGVVEADDAEVLGDPQAPAPGPPR